MYVGYYKEYSQCLNRDMEFKVYGHAGLPVLEFPTQNGKFYEFEDFLMADALSDYLENGKIQVFCCTSIDTETISDIYGNEDHRAYMYEQWYYYICDELLPLIMQIRDEMDCNDGSKPITTGFSSGATHAMNFFLRRPDLFGGTIALSGCYRMSEYFPNYHNPLIFNNSPLDFLPKMSWDHPWLDLYRESIIIFCVGQGRWESVGIHDSIELKQQFDRMQVDSWFDMWGYDVDHDWIWWRKQMPYFIGKIVGE